MNDRGRKIVTRLAILAVFVMLLPILYDPAVSSRLLGIPAKAGVLPDTVDTTVTGTKRFDSASKYVGEWKNGLFDGKGTYFKTHEKDDCEWKAGRKHGQCTITQKGKVVFSGQYRNDRREGFGKKLWPDGSIYEGEWKQDRCHGKGTMTYADGRAYAGDWQAGYYHGYGVFSWPSGDSFAGEFKKGKREGRGVYRWADGTQYAGTWQSGKKHGKGTYIHADGSKVGEIWENGNRVKP